MKYLPLDLKHPAITVDILVYSGTEKAIKSLFLILVCPLIQSLACTDHKAVNVNNICSKAILLFLYLVPFASPIHSL